jgi:Cu2+-exporting ATPase
MLLSAAAEQRFHHPIAMAVLHKAEEVGVDVPRIDAAQYRIGHGITVGVEGRTIRVGSRRFMELEGIALTGEVTVALDQAHREGHIMVMVGKRDSGCSSWCSSWD